MKHNWLSPWHILMQNHSAGDTVMLGRVPPPPLLTQAGKVIIPQSIKNMNHQSGFQYASIFIITGVVLKQQQIPGFSQAHKINNAIMNSSLIIDS